MPRVPVLNRPQVQTRPLSGVDAPLSAFTGPAPALAQAAQGLGQVAQLVEREAIRADEMRVEQAEAQYRARVDGLMVDPKTGILNQRGTNAIEGLDPFRDRLTATASDITATLSTDRQRELFQARAERIRRDADVRAQDFVGGEIQRGYDAAHKANLQRDRDDIARLAAAGDMAGVDATVAQMDARIALYGDNTGTAPEAIQQARQVAVSQARTLQILTLVDRGRMDAADALASQYGARLTADDRATVEKVVAEGRARAQVQTIASRILDEAKGSATAAYEMSRDIEDPALRTAVRKVVTAEYDARDAARKTDQENIYLAATNRVDAAPGVPVRSVIPASEWEAMSLTQREALERRAEAPTNNNKRWFEFYSMTPQERGKLTPAEFQTRYWSTFDTAHRSRAEGMFKDAQADKAGAGFATGGIMTDNERVMGALVGMHLVSDPERSQWGTDDFRLAAQFEQEADVRIRTFEGETGRKATATEKQRIITALGWEMSPVNVRRRFRSDEATRADIVEEGAAERTYVPLDRIPEAEVERIREAMRLNGKTVTERAIEDAYAAVVLRLRNRYDTIVGNPIPDGTF